MSGVINYLIDKPFEFRVVISLFFLIFVVWKLLGKRILWIFSVVPFLLKQVFRGLYLLIQMILSILHKKIGWIFTTADEKFVEIGENIDTKLESWYQQWKNSQKPKLKKCFLIYIICCLVIILPSYIKTENKIIKVGENIFLSCEKFTLNQLRKCAWYDSEEVLTLEEDWGQKTNAGGIFKNEFEVALIVAGLNTTLLVRDVPDKENSEVLGNLYNDDYVIWNGEIAFSYVDNRVEPWAKVTMEDGTTGWSRMDYLYPVDYEKMIYYVTKSQKMN